MEIKRFGLGIRFPSELDTNSILELILNALPYHELNGATLAITAAPKDEIMPYGTILLAMSGLSLKRARRIYRAASENAALMAGACTFRTFVQTNDLTRCEVLQSVGLVTKEGLITGGEAAFEGMRFLNSTIRSPRASKERYLILATPDERHSAEERCKAALNRLMNRAPHAKFKMLPVANTSKGLLDSLLTALGGRYARTPSGVFLGFLPDDSAVIDESYLEGKSTGSSLLGEKAVFAIQQGYRNLYVAIGSGYDSDDGRGFESTLSKAFPEGYPEGLRFIFFHNDLNRCPIGKLPHLPNLQDVSELDAVLDLLNAWTLIRNGYHVIWAVEERSDSDRHLRKRIDACVKKNHRKMYLFDDHAPRYDTLV